MWYLEHSGIEKIPLHVSTSKSHLQKEKVMPYFLTLPNIRGLLEKYPTFGREKETGLPGALDT